MSCHNDECRRRRLDLDEAQDVIGRFMRHKDFDLTDQTEVTALRLLVQQLASTTGDGFQRGWDTAVALFEQGMSLDDLQMIFEP